MNLNRLQRMTLESYVKWRDKPPTYGSLMAGQSKPLILTGLNCAAIAFGFYLIRIPEGGLVSLGLWLGFLLAASGRSRLVSAIWPVIVRVLDWARVEQVLRDQRVE